MYKNAIQLQQQQQKHTLKMVSFYEVHVALFIFVQNDSDVAVVSVWVTNVCCFFFAALPC